MWEARLQIHKLIISSQLRLLLNFGWVDALIQAMAGTTFLNLAFNAYNSQE